MIPVNLTHRYDALLPAFAARLRILARASDYTITDLAEKLDVGYQTVNTWYKGKGFPSIIALIRLAQLFDVSTDWLLGIQKGKKDERHPQQTQTSSRTSSK